MGQAGPDSPNFASPHLLSSGRALSAGPSSKASRVKGWKEGWMQNTSSAIYHVWGQITCHTGIQTLPCPSHGVTVRITVSYCENM